MEGRERGRVYERADDVNVKYTWPFAFSRTFAELPHTSALSCDMRDDDSETKSISEAFCFV